ncbi:MAG: glucose-6-phosphate isomerase [Cytophagales bacterium]|nr:glucose-6-phosphate isomerase [Cytophagales bacterium]
MNLNLKDFFATDPQRFEHFSQSIAIETNASQHSIFCDLSKNLIDRSMEFTLIARAARAGLEVKRDTMFAGEAINNTEGRSVSHVRLRDPADTEVRAVLDALLTYAEVIRADDSITDIVNIGIGGSDLGPAFAVRALDQFVNHKKRYHFVSNVDGHEMNAALRHCKPASTLFIIASKTFTTAETMLNASTARAWFIANGGTADGSSQLDTSRHFCAVTTNVAAATNFGINTTFGFWDWVGGRYSIWSAIGLSLAIAIGDKGFRAFLAGAHAMDKHFKTAPLAQNLPVRLGLLDVYYRNDLKFTSRNVAPYSSALGRLPAYLQQLEMESNGKSVDKNGKPLAMSTSPVVWGEAGTNGQHAFFQMLHQGTDVIPVEFVAVKTPTFDAGIGFPMNTASQANQHKALLANALAQAQALMQGKADAGGHKNFAGNRPSTFILLDALTPETLGALIALYEHRVFTSGVLWGINSFDQFGVELGKVLAKDIEPRLANGDADGLDASTAGLLNIFYP